MTPEHLNELKAKHASNTTHFEAHKYHEGGDSKSYIYVVQDGDFATSEETASVLAYNVNDLIAAVPELVEHIQELELYIADLETTNNKYAELELSHKRLEVALESSRVLNSELSGRHDHLQMSFDRKMINIKFCLEFYAHLPDTAWPAGASAHAQKCLKELENDK